MLIETTLLVDDLVVIQGLQDGSLKRRGSVIYEVETGTIVCHLVESPSLTEQSQALPEIPLLKYAEQINDGIDCINNGIDCIQKISELYEQINQSLSSQQKPLSSIYRQINPSLSIPQQQLSSLLQINQIASAASVLNLGVSIAGFAYMTYKFEQVQTALDKVQKSLDTGFNRIDERFDILSGQLVYIYLLLEENRNKQQQISNRISEVYRALLVDKTSELGGVILNLDRNQNRYNDNFVQNAIGISSTVRLFLSDQAMRVQPVLEAQEMLITDVAIQGWVVATVTEAYLLLENGQIDDARNLLAQEVLKFKNIAVNWADVLLANKHSQIATVYRFATPQFKKHILPERVDRIAYISSVDKSLSKEKIEQKTSKAKVEFKMFYARKEFDERWIRQQIAVAEYLDGLSELLARLESLQAFADLCKSKGVNSSRDILPGKDAQPGLYIFPAN
jgi:hypothetical protein